MNRLWKYWCKAMGSHAYDDDKKDDDKEEDDGDSKGLSKGQKKLPPQLQKAIAKKSKKNESLDLVSAYRSMYEHHQKDADGNVIPHEDEEVDFPTKIVSTSPTKNGSEILTRIYVDDLSFLDHETEFHYLSPNSPMQLEDEENDFQDTSNFICTMPN